MDIAFVTGADAGPGLAIARRLIGMGCRVYALATQFARNPFPHDDFIPLTCDLADPAALTKAVEDVVAKEGHVTFVVHAARREATSLFDSPVEDLTTRLHVGLLAPIALARVTLPWLRKEQGHFLVLCWDGQGHAPGGPVTAAIEGALHHFTEQLFEELRSDGVRATTVYARPNPETPADALTSIDPQAAVNPELLADAVENLFRVRPSNVISTLVIRPCATTESPRIARSAELAGIVTRDVQLPPRHNFPPEAEGIPTPPRARPADAPPPGEEELEDDEEDDDDWDPRNEPLPWVQRREAQSRDSAESDRNDSSDRRDSSDRAGEGSDSPDADGRDAAPRRPSSESDSGERSRPAAREPRRDDRSPEQRQADRQRQRDRQNPYGRRRGDLPPNRSRAQEPRRYGPGHPPPEPRRRPEPSAPGQESPAGERVGPNDAAAFADDDRANLSRRPPNDYPDSDRGDVPEMRPTQDYPDAEKEAAARAAARDSSFRTPHSDAEDDSAGDDDSPNADTDFDAESPDNSGRRASRPPMDTDVADTPPLTPVSAGPSDTPPVLTAASTGHHGGRPAPAPRRHRGLGRKPPPGSAGRRAPDAD